MSRTDRVFDPSTEAMLAEHERVSALYLYNAGIGEKRVSLYLTLVSGGAALFLGLAQCGVDRMLLLWSAVGVLALVVLVELPTFQRLTERRVRSTQYLRAINRIHCYFTRADPSLKQYYSWPPSDRMPSFVGRARVLAGLRDVMAVLNSLAVGAVVKAIAVTGALSWVPSTALALVVAAGVWFLQQRYEDRQLAQAEAVSEQYVRFPGEGQADSGSSGPEISGEQ